jgi:hypothetical protein
MVDRFCWVKGGAAILIQGVGRIIFGVTPVSPTPEHAQIAELCAFWRIPE